MTSLSAAAIEERRKRIRERIEGAALRAGRDPEGIALLAVTKGHPIGLIREAVHAGLSLFGENHVAEGARKIEALRPEFPRLIWRLIGPLQSNKVKGALQYFSALESLDRERLAVRLERFLTAENRVLPVWLEVNIGGEATKSGALPQEIGNLARICLDLPHLDVRGLMSVPPFAAEPEKTRPHFCRLREIRDDLAGRFGRPFPELSMGMSHDFEVAVEEGATEVRIGTALFGPREAA